MSVYYICTKNVKKYGIMLILKLIAHKKIIQNIEALFATLKSVNYRLPTCLLIQIFD